MRTRACAPFGRPTTPGVSLWTAPVSPVTVGLFLETSPPTPPCQNAGTAGNRGFGPVQGGGILCTTPREVKRLAAERDSQLLAERKAEGQEDEAPAEASVA